MTLRTRLAIAGILIAFATLAGTWLMASSQSDYVHDRTDDRLTRILPAARAAVRRTVERDRAPRALSSAISDAWIGEIGPDGRLVAVIAPVDDPGLVPDYGMDDVSTVPSTHGTLSGRTSTVRVVATARVSGVHVVVALPIDEQESILASLNRTSLLLAVTVVTLTGLLSWWVSRMGITPLVRMSESARRIAQGETDHRVPTQPGRAEAAVLAVALNEMIDTLRAADQRVKQFIADVSHELRTPLTTLRGYSDLYDSGMLTDNDQVADAMRRIRSESDRMARIVDDLIELRGIEQARLNLTSSRIDEIVEQCAADLRAAHPPRRFLTETRPCSAEVDRDLFTQAVMALGTNAADHTPVDTLVRLSAGVTEGRLRVTVSDNGPGIESRHHAHLFERLYRVDQGRSGSGGHGGVGLSIVAAIVSAHGGRVGVESSPGEGSTFWIELPSAGTGRPARVPGS